MGQELIKVFIYSFLFYIIVLNITLAIIVKPKFIFGEDSEPEPPKVKQGFYLFLLITSIWVGTMAYFMRVLNGLIIIN